MPADWTCPSCYTSNFASRESCKNCSYPRPVGLGDSGDVRSSPYGGGASMPPHPDSKGKGKGPPREFREGDWICTTCGNHNFSCTVVCKKCGEEVREGFKRGDWICRSCHNHNFAKRSTCANVVCGAPKPPEPEMSRAQQHYESQKLAKEEEGLSIANMPKNPLSLMSWNQPKDPNANAGWANQSFRKGDWACHKCGNHNFASRLDCKRCGAKRENFEEEDESAKAWAEYKRSMGPPELQYTYGR